MPRQKYFVDWSDPYCPEIIRWEEGKTNRELEKCKSFSECKKEILAHAQQQIAGWQDIIWKTRGCRVKDIS